LVSIQLSAYFGRLFRVHDGDWHMLSLFYDSSYSAIIILVCFLFVALFPLVIWS